MKEHSIAAPLVRAWNAVERAWSIVETHSQALLAAAIGAMFILRLLYCLGVELLPEETYYWNWSFASHLDIGYFDHPPMVAWLIRACTSVLGNTEIGVRFGALICSVVTSIFVYQLTRRMFGRVAAQFALLLVQMLPFFFLSGVLMTPDAALTAAWAATLYYFERALIHEQRSAWAAVGLCLGLGLLSKYTIGLLGISAACFMLIDAPSRHWFRRWEPYAAVLLAIALFAPVILWNVRHEWASFAFQTVHRLTERPQFSLHKLIAASLIVLTPTGLWAAVAALSRRRPPPTDRTEAPDKKQAMDAAQTAGRRGWLFLRVTTVVPLCVFALFSVRHEVKLDWTGVVWLGALPAIAAYNLGDGCSGMQRFVKRAWPPTLGILAVIYGIGLYALAIGIPGRSVALSPELIPIGWRDLALQVSDIAHGIKTADGVDVIVVGMDRYATASELAFYAPDQLGASYRTTAAHLFGGMGLMYELWFPKSQLVGRDLLLVSWKSRDLEAAALAPNARYVGPIQSGTVMRSGAIVRPFYYRVLRGYQVAASTVK